jgi:hypothetical protein
MFDLNNASATNMASINLPSYARLDNLVILPSLSFDKSSATVVYVFMANMCTFSTLWKLLLFCLIAANFKNFPLVYHMRLLNAVRWLLRSQRSPAGPKPEHLFQPIITSSRTSLLETDCNLHKSNSTYFSDHDIARTHVITTLFSKAIEKVRGGTTALVNGKVPSFGVALGAVSCTFKRDLKPYESYDMWTRILSWDEKWVYIVTHFVKKGAQINPRECILYPRQNSRAGSGSSTPVESVSSAASSLRGSICSQSSSTAQGAVTAYALSKIVFKDGRITIKPETMLEAAGLLPPKPSEPVAEHELHPVESQIKVNLDNSGMPQKTMQTLDDLDVSDRDSSLSRCSSMDAQAQGWTWERVEAERQRGLKTAKLLAGLNALEFEMNDDVSLGRHTDGTGIGGVVATLAQLGRLSNYQLI